MGKRIKKHLGLKIFRKDIVALQPMLALQSFTAPSDLESSFPGIIGLVRTK